MADKLLLLTVFVVLTLPGLDLANRLPLWLTVVVISRDVIIVLTVAVVNLASGPRTFKPSMAGKAATLIYFITGIVTMYFNYLEQTSSLVTLCVFASLAIAVISGLHYIVHAIIALEQA
jgi:cardiolipin synthase